MDLVYEHGSVSVAQIHEAIPDAPSYSAVRALMGTLVDKGHLAHTRDGRRYLYHPTVPLEDASSSALERLVRTFFGGSPAKAALALIDEGELDADELARLEHAIARSREQGR